MDADIIQRTQNTSSEGKLNKMLRVRRSSLEHENNRSNQCIAQLEIVRVEAMDSDKRDAIRSDCRRSFSLRSMW